MFDRSWTPRAALGGLLTAATLGVLAACGGAPEPLGEIAAAQTAVRNAEQSEAVTLAPGELAQAREKLAEAEAALAEEENTEARRLAEQALVDARLAEAKARAELARRNLAQAREGVRALQSEAVR